MRDARRVELLLIVALLAIPPAAEQREPRREEAVRLYDEGRYAEAGVLLGRLDELGRADGPLLYRLHYCQRAANDPAAAGTLERARVKLEQEVPESTDLEASFYLANAYGNLGRPDEVRRVASAATGRVESGALAEPTSGIERFRLGKLYADQNREDAAARWYGLALEAFAADASSGTPAYVRWASRYLAELAYRREDYIDAARYFTSVVDVERPSNEDLDRLGVSHARNGDYREAAQAWRRIERLDPANADRARYASRLCEQAAEIDELSAAAPDGRLWIQWTQPELEALMRAQAEEARTANQLGRETPFAEREERLQLQARLDAARAWFVAAALEHVLRGHNLREAAFFGGYAPLVFRAREWRLARPAPRPSTAGRPDPPTPGS